MWCSGLAGGMLWLQFGAEVAGIDHKGRPRVVGDYALHIDCAWRWVEAWGDVRAEHVSEIEQVAALASLRPMCVSATAGELGDFRLSFEDGSMLVVEPDGDEEEFWRLFQPGRDGPHFVVGADGITD